MSIIENARALQNRIPVALSVEEHERLALHAKPRAFEQGDFIYEPIEPIEHAYFLLGGMASVLSTMQNGASVEARVVGKEGFIGFPPLIGIKNTPTNTISQSLHEISESESAS
jgi:CRP-like cAMP-binding protein